MGKLSLQFDNLLLLTIAKRVLLCIIIAASLVWVLWWVMLSEPLKKETKYHEMLDDHIHCRFLRTDGYYGSALIFQSGIFILVGLLSYGVIELRKKTKLLGGLSWARERKARPRLTTYSLMIKGPFGVVTAAEALCVVGLLFLLLYSFGRSTYVNIQNLNASDPTTFSASLQLEKLSGASYFMGRAAMISFSLLWIPVSRGSPFLRLINVPFENAIKYHTWLAVLTLIMLTLHSIGYILFYVLSHAPKQIIEWEAEGESCSVVAGVVAWICGLVMWATSLSFFRRRWYEIFFGVHHLYIVFLVFWFYHVIWTVHVCIIPCLLFAVDRFLRMVQSHHSVDVLSAKIMESGSIKLEIASNKTKGIAYHPLSSWYLQWPSLSRLMKFQWHFFSVTSTGMDGKEALSIVIKPLGNWTNCLKEQVLESTKGANKTCPFSFKAAVEGPYGDESDFFLRYKVVVLVGGGIGVTPLLAVLQDILHRKRLGEDNLPSSIHLYHCVRKQEELCVLNSVDPNLILPHYEKQGLDIRVNAYVTSPTCKISDGNGRKDDQKTLDLATFGGSPVRQYTNNSPEQHASTILSPPTSVAVSRSTPIRGICAISTSGNAKWVFMTILASITGFYICWGLSNVLIVKRYDAPFPNYHRAHLVAASMALGISLFGGTVVLLWGSQLKSPPRKDDAAIAVPSLSKASSKSPSPSGLGSHPNATHLSINNDRRELQGGLTNDIENAGSLDGSPWSGNLHLQSRPEWRDIFLGLSSEYGGHNIGVLVSGPLGMQQDIAVECRKHSKVLQGDSSSTIFHFHTISFNV